MSWQLANGSLPVFPLVHVRDEGGAGVLSGAIRGPRSGNWWVSVGCNLSYIPDYCGGIYVTALNVVVRRFEPNWSDERTRQAFNALHSVEDYGDWGDTVAAYESVPSVGALGISVHDHEVMAKMGAASLAARLFALSLAWNRSTVLSWDTRRGYTRRLIKWMYDALPNGVRVPNDYGFGWAVSRKYLDADPVRLLTSVPNNPDARCHVVYPTRLATGLYFYNHNSGNEVATTSLHVSSTRNRRTDASAPPNISIAAAKADAAEVVARLGHDFQNTPVHYYPM